MKNMVRTLLIAFLVFFISIGILYSLSYLKQEVNVGFFSGFVGLLVYAFVYTFWGYWLLAYVYVQLVKKDMNRVAMYLKSLLIVVIGYMFSRIPDIIDNDFFLNFNWSGFLVFFLFAPILTEIELLFRKKQ